jgi:hypothetical protein
VLGGSGVEAEGPVPLGGIEDVEEADVGVAELCVE